jgi:asparagine synthase (glutamine-hydrolysing)
MCGIAGILDMDGRPTDEGVLRLMAAALRHRGPDAEGVFRQDGRPAVGLAHRRLSIIDLSEAADQPIPNEDGSVQVMLNGEIYNYRELRRSLEGRHRFRSGGDTEVIAHLYEEKGEDAVGELEGMFAIALWDARRRRLVLARDAFGKKPLYYATLGHKLLFGSEVKALLAAGHPAAMEPEALGPYLALGYAPTPLSFFRGVRKLPPASLLVADASGVSTRTYWEPRFPRPDEIPRVEPEAAHEGLAEHLGQAVRSRLVAADVPVGLLLSGGIDSAAVAWLACRVASGLHTFTVGFAGDRFYDERPHAEAVARHLGTTHHSFLVEAKAGELVETLLHHHDEPFGDSSALPTYLVAREARRHVKVVLNGDGGDEVLAGYDRFGAALLAERVPAVVRPSAAWASHVLPWGTRHQGFLRRMKRFASALTLSPEERLATWAGVFGGRAEDLLPPGHAAAGLLASYGDAGRTLGPATALSRLLFVNARTYLLDDLLPKMDRMTMAHGLEARSPFLDRRLFEFLAKLPDGLKRRGTQGKLLLRDAMRGHVPAEVLMRPKHGFGVPVGEWFRGELQPMVGDLLGHGARLRRLLRAEAMQAIVEENQSGRADRGQELWALVTLELWLRKHHAA